MPVGQYTRKRKPVIDRIMKRVVIQPNGCWIWTGSLDGKGYGQVNIGDGVIRRVHKILHENKYGPVPEGLELDHKCHDPKTCPGGKGCPHRRCVNPDHTEPSTRLNNSSPERSCGRTLQGSLPIPPRRDRNFCINGHEYTDTNTYLYKGSKRCRQCRKDRR